MYKIVNFFIYEGARLKLKIKISFRIFLLEYFLGNSSSFLEKDRSILRCDPNEYIYLLGAELKLNFSEKLFQIVPFLYE
jgi:hypothetical protein